MQLQLLRKIKFPMSITYIFHKDAVSRKPHERRSVVGSSAFHSLAPENIQSKVWLAIESCGMKDRWQNIVQN